MASAVAKLSRTESDSQHRLAIRLRSKWLQDAIVEATYHPVGLKAHNNEKIGHQPEDALEHIERSRATCTEVARPLGLTFAPPLLYEAAVGGMRESTFAWFLFRARF